MSVPLVEEARPGEDRFYHGTISKLFRGSRSGVVRSVTGREVTFAFPHTILLGRLKTFEDLREGMTVGFDVGWTSKGLRVTLMRAATAGDRFGTRDSDP